MTKWLIFLSILFTSACSNWERVEIDGRTLPPYGVSPGTLCTIETLDGQTHVFRVIKISDTSFIGKETQVRFEDVKKIQIKDDQNTVAWTVMSVPFVIMGFLAIALASALGG